MTSAKVKSSGARWAAATAVLAGVFLAPRADAQTFFYTEIAKDGRIYVFASSSRYDAFTKSNGADIGPVIERPGYGPNGETVVFDSEDAINLYNFKHGLPGEQFPKSEESRKSEFPSGKFSGLMFGDYYWYYERHQDQISSTDPTVIEGAARPVVPAHLLLLRLLVQRITHHTFPARGEQQRGFRRGRSRPVPERRVPEMDLSRGPAADARHPSDADVRLAGRILGAAPYREDAGRPLSTGFISRFRIHLRRPDCDRRPQLRRAVRQRVGQRLRDAGGQDPAIRNSLRAGIPGSPSRASTASGGGRRAETVTRPRASGASGRTSHGLGRSICGRSASRVRTTSPIRQSPSGRGSRYGSSSRRKRTCFSAWTT